MTDEPESYMSVREMVMEIRQDVKALNVKAEQMEAARRDVEDHEDRLRSLERWKYGIPFSVVAAMSAALTALFGKGV